MTGHTSRRQRVEVSTLGSRLTDARGKRTQVEIANKAGLSHGTISKWERDLRGEDHPFDALRRLVLALDADGHEILTGQPFARPSLADLAHFPDDLLEALDREVARVSAERGGESVGRSEVVRAIVRSVLLPAGREQLPLKPRGSKKAKRGPR